MVSPNTFLYYSLDIILRVLFWSLYSILKMLNFFYGHPPLTLLPQISCSCPCATQYCCITFVILMNILTSVCCLVCQLLRLFASFVTWIIITSWCAYICMPLLCWKLYSFFCWLVCPFDCCVVLSVSHLSVIYYISVVTLPYW